MSIKAYRIREWHTFETSESKRYRALTWVAIPTKQDGKGRRRLVRRENGAALFGAWNALVQVAGRLPERGLLADDDSPLDAHDLEVMTDLPAELFEKLFTILTDPDEKIGWLELVEWDPPNNCWVSPNSNQQPPEGEQVGDDKTLSTKRNENETLRDITQRNENETEPQACCAQGTCGSDSTINGNGASLSPEINSSSSSPSLSLPRGSSRPACQVRFWNACEPLIGRREGKRLPCDAPGYRADETCVRNAWDDIWPEDMEPEEGVPRMEQAMEAVEYAKRAKKPIAALQDKLKRKGLMA